MSLSTNYQECEEYILAIPRFVKKKHEPAELNNFIAAFCNPRQGTKVIHVAGTNGKGSVCAYLQAILSHAGITTGLFTSPHLTSLRERIQINGEAVTEEEFTAVFRTLKEKFAGAAEEIEPTFFEFLFLMALLIFEKRGVEYLILETGLGGRLDATNAINEKTLTVITRIGYDHMEHLGDTLELIAAEKAGIMRPGVPLVTIKQAPLVQETISQLAAKRGVPVELVLPDAIKIHEITNKTIDFSYQYRYDRIVRFLLAAKALYQTENASLAVHAAFTLSDPRITEEKIASGLFTMFWPGRMEEAAPGIIIDGAHNEDGIRAFIDSARVIPCTGKRYLLFGAAREKKSRAMISRLREAGFFREMIACSFNNPRSLTVAELKTEFESARVFADAGSALAYLRAKREKDDLIFVAGSLYLIAEIRQDILKRNTSDTGVYQ